MMVTNIVSGYLDKVLSPKSLLTTVQTMVNLLEPHLDKFDTIAFTGMSGTLVAPSVAAQLNKELLMVRKTERIPSHAYWPIEGNKECKNYIILDDQISTGRTIKDMVEKINNFQEFTHTPKCVGIALYYQSFDLGDNYYKIKINEILGTEVFIVNVG